ncbi:hypothetical protein IAD21_01321 [Abditibacteriota bacterium]|nr:hypothetical protein IAD21_01321 [Abditibacteriota bacterium]
MHGPAAKVIRNRYKLRAMLANTAILGEFDHRGKFASEQDRDFVVWRSFDQAGTALPNFFSKKGELQYSTLSINVYYRRIFFSGTYRGHIVVGYIPLILNLGEEQLLARDAINIAILPGNKDDSIKFSSLAQLVKESRGLNSIISRNKLDPILNDILGFTLKTSKQSTSDIDGFSVVRGSVLRNDNIAESQLEDKPRKIVMKQYFGVASMSLYCNSEMILISSELFSDVSRESKINFYPEKAYAPNSTVNMSEESLNLAAEGWLKYASRF